MKPHALVLRTAGTNCDEETEFALHLAGAETSRLHVNVLRSDPGKLLDFSILVIPGGFSYGDDLGAGKVLANELVTHLRDPLEDFVRQGRLVIGICNGFQVLVKTGLLPGLNRWEQEATLTFNDSHKFEDRWTQLQAPETRSVVVDDGESLYLPVAHAEGKFVLKDRDMLDELKKNGQVAFRYTDPEGDEPAYPDNPNGSIDNIAAVCDPTGRITGMMPHPERHVLPWHHPRWTREGLQDEGDGLRIWKRAVEFASEELVQAAG
jgi:phosphoribosylformylglycinamidine synthase